MNFKIHKITLEFEKTATTKKLYSEIRLCINKRPVPNKRPYTNKRPFSETNNINKPV